MAWRLALWQNSQTIRDSATLKIATLAQWAVSGAKEGDPAKIPAAPQLRKGGRLVRRTPCLDSSTRKDAPEGSGPLSQLPGSKRIWRRQVDYGCRASARQQAHGSSRARLLFAKRKSNAAEKSASPGITNTSSKGTSWSSSQCLFVTTAAPCRTAANGQERDWRGRSDSRHIPAGREPDVYGNGLARKIPAGSVLQFQIHYNGDSLKDDASDLLAWASSSRKSLRVSNPSIEHRQ